jgi:hypothetical protein
MNTAQRRDSGVVHLRTRDTARRERGAQFRPIASRFSQQHQARSFKPRLHLRDRCLEGAGRVVNLRVGDDSEELVKARPGDGPRRPAFRQRGERAYASSCHGESSR